MGTTQTRLHKIGKIRNILSRASEKEKGVLKERLISLMMMEGSSRKNIVEIIESFKGIGEVTERIVDEEVFLFYG